MKVQQFRDFIMVCGFTVEARKLEHNCSHTLKVKYKES